MTVAADRTFSIGEVHVGIPVEQRKIEGVWECATDSAHSDSAPNAENKPTISSHNWPESTEPCTSNPH